MRQKINFHIPEEITGKEFAKFLNKNNLHFFTPKKKGKITENIVQLHKSLQSVIINEKYKKGKLKKVNKT